MKTPRLILLSGFLFFALSVRSQEITLSALYGSNSYNKFARNMGYSVGYEHPVKAKNRLGVSLSQSFIRNSYHEIFPSGADGLTYDKNVEPNNQCYALSVFYLMDVSHRKQSHFLFGPQIGLHFFRINEFVVQRLITETETMSYRIEEWEKFKLGLGLIMRYERKVGQQFFVFGSVLPEAILYKRFGLVGSSAPSLIGSIRWQLGLKMKL